MGDRDGKAVVPLDPIETVGNGRSNPASVQGPLENPILKRGLSLRGT